MTSEQDLKDAAVEAARAPITEWINARLPKEEGPFKKFLEHIRDEFCDHRLTIERAKSKSGYRTNSASTNAAAVLGKTPKRFIFDGRMEIARLLLCVHRFSVTAAGEAVGYQTTDGFIRAVKRWCGESPAKVRGTVLPPAAGYPTYYRAFSGKLPPEEHRALIAQLEAVCPGAVPAAKEEYDPPPSMVDVPASERWMAALLWGDIRERSFAGQKAGVRCRFFSTTALFDLLRETSREEGRKDRQLGVRLARLALLSLDRCLEALGDRGPDLRALGLAWLARCLRLAHQLAAAEAKFREAWAEWRTPRANPDPAVAAEIALHEGTLRMFQRRYDEALGLLEKSLSLFEEAGDIRGQIQTLNQRAAVRGFAAELEESIVDLNAAASLVDEEREPYFAFTIYKNLANAHGRSGTSDLALKNLGLSKEYLSRIDYPLGETDLKWLEASIKEVSGDSAAADLLYRAARRDLVNANETSLLGLLLLDWSALCSEQRRHARVLRSMSQALPILQSHEFHPETLAGFALLSQAITAGEISNTLLREVQHRLRRDPLVLLI